MCKSAFLILILLASICTQAQDLKPIHLPTPQTSGGRPLMQVLKDRQTRREFRPERLPTQVLSNLLGPRSASTVLMADALPPRR